MTRQQNFKKSCGPDVCEDQERVYKDGKCYPCPRFSRTFATDGGL